MKIAQPVRHVNEFLYLFCPSFWFIVTKDQRDNPLGEGQLRLDRIGVTSVPFAKVIRDEIIHGDRIGLRVLLTLHKDVLKPMPGLLHTT